MSVTSSVPPGGRLLFHSSWPYGREAEKNSSPLSIARSAALRAGSLDSLDERSVNGRVPPGVPSVLHSWKPWPSAAAKKAAPPAAVNPVSNWQNKQRPRASKRLPPGVPSVDHSVRLDADWEVLV